jgi:hypothetical protein
MRRVLFAVLLAGLLSSAASAAQPRGHAEARAQSAPLDPVGIVLSGDPAALKRTGVDWYLTYGFDGATVPGMQRASVIRLVDGVDRAALARAVTAAPGSAWIIGNEPNVPTQATSDAMAPDVYATRLHDLSDLIKSYDPTAIIVGPNVLNWTDTCTGCGGYTNGSSWTADFYAAYVSMYGTRPPLDRWALHTYELDWSNTPTLHTDYDQRQVTDFRAWLESMPDEAGRPIWNTELGFHWAYPGWTLNDGKLVPVGNYDTTGVNSWMSTTLSWLFGDAQSLGVERSFLYAQAPPSLADASQWGGLALFTGNSADSALTPAGAVLRDFLKARAVPASDPQ